MTEIVNLLKNNITTKNTLGETIDAFCEICGDAPSDSEFLFETGVFSFTCDEQFYFSLVRQDENENDEYSQIHVDVIYPPTNKISDFSRTDWFENVEDFKKDVLSSKEFAILNNEPIFKVGIYEEET